MKCPNCDGTYVVVDIPGVSRTLLELEMEPVECEATCFDCGHLFEVELWATADMEE